MLLRALPTAAAALSTWFEARGVCAMGDWGEHLRAGSRQISSDTELRLRASIERTDRSGDDSAVYPSAPLMLSLYLYSSDLGAWLLITPIPAL
jgi:hypothetical protein